MPSILRVFGEMCVVADTDKKVGRTKIDPRGKISLFVGYSTQHEGDVYRLLNPKQVGLYTVEIGKRLVKHGQSFTRLK